MVKKKKFVYLAVDRRKCKLYWCNSKNTKIITIFFQLSVRLSERN